MLLNGAAEIEETATQYAPRGMWRTGRCEAQSRVLVK
jgi:hypothetical protein